MQEHFYLLCEQLFGRLHQDEILLCHFEGEASDFVRFNHNKVRQAGNVIQQTLSINLIKGNKQTSGHCELSGLIDNDLNLTSEILVSLRKQLGLLPEDPYLNYSQEINSSEKNHINELPETGEMLEQIQSSANSLDLVGILANGTLYTGFSSSSGQRNWHSSKTFNFDWSCYHQTDKAVKKNYSGFDWQNTRLSTIMDETKEQLAILKTTPRKITPGEYRVYLAPGALSEILDMMSWGGFGLKSHRTSQTPLIKMVSGNQLLNPAITLTEENIRGLAPGFTEAGFILPDKVELISNGHYKNTLASARSAKEYNQTVNCDHETPRSLDMSAGNIKNSELLSTLGTGIYINNLWYCNFSDHNNCKITGMTRFACYWVDKGEIQAPVNVMRFDDSIYNILGSNLAGLSAEKELLFDPGTYQKRSTSSTSLPGAIVDNFRLTL